MNIIEALRTGKPLRRPVAKHIGSKGIGYLGNGFVIHLLITDKSVKHAWGIHDTTFPELINEDDLLADDWEIKNADV